MVELPMKTRTSGFNRQLARVAGFLMSVSAAVNRAPLYLRKLYHDQSMGENMDGMTGDAVLASKDLQY